MSASHINELSLIERNDIIETRTNARENNEKCYEKHSNVLTGVKETE